MLKILVDKKDILKLYKKLDKYQEKLVLQEQYWRKCNPCINKGECCINSDTTILTSESRIIKACIRELPENMRNTLKANVDNGIRCPFRTEASCIIHDVRPLTCRVVPYLASQKKDNKRKIEYLLTSDDCKSSGSMEQDMVGLETVNYYKSNLFVDLCINYSGATRKYINKDYLIINEDTFNKLCKGSSMYPIDMLIKDYNNLFRIDIK